MTIVILRSIGVGIAFVVGAIAIGVFIGLPLALHFLSRNAPSGSAEIGWDLVAVYHDSPLRVILPPLVIFVVGFMVGFRHFSHSLAHK